MSASTSPTIITDSIKKHNTTISSSTVPTESNFDVQHSLFFQRCNELPSPQTVREQARAQHLAGTKTDKRKTFRLAGPNVHPPPVLFESLGLFVKWGTGVRIAEGQTLYALRNCLEAAVPVPEIYGWRTDGKETFLYMEAVGGQTLEQAWDTMEVNNRLDLCRQLRTIFEKLRRFEQDPLYTFVGSIARSPLYDRAINPRYVAEAGPFTSVKEFHDWFTSLYRRPMSDPHSVPMETFRQYLPDDAEIRFTHGDLHPSNIIITSSSPSKVIAIVDWEQAGWLPVYWEDCKARFTADYSGEWSEKYLPIILDHHVNTWESWDYYTSAMGC